MNQSKIAVRYVKAFFELAQDKNQLDKVKKDIEVIAATCGQTDVQLLLESPVVKTSKKKALFSDIFKGKIQELSLSFLLMIAENKREVHIPMICLDFMEQYRTYKGVKAAKVTTASLIDSDLQKQISKVISEVFKTDVELTTDENTELIGGFILRVGDEQIDASVSTKLSKLKREFLDRTI
ncbi:MAG: ATP synthase F1 subunit delta [Salinivirgaceae bacterium]|jgi:F-type H+-transporting ATPase subunit delta|nr:ATP synthase F1 subunit delta [Salinivirgaceae bacterium]